MFSHLCVIPQVLWFPTISEHDYMWIRFAKLSLGVGECIHDAWG